MFERAPADGASGLSEMLGGIVLNPFEGKKQQ
jgi:hypothetical protein